MGLPYQSLLPSWHGGDGAYRNHHGLHSRDRVALATM